MNFEEKVHNYFISEYNIDLEKEGQIEIDNLPFPNYIVNKVLNINNEEYTDFEYYRIINKIFGFNYQETKCSHYEVDDIRILKDDIVFDCGANTGIFSLYAAYKGKCVYAFEPSTMIRHYLRSTKRYNNDKFKIVPYGVSNISGTKILAQADNPGATRTNDFIMPEYHKILYNEVINVITLDDFVEKTEIIPNFIKMDIENGEIAALEGARMIIQKYHPTFSISIHEENLDKLNYIKTLFTNNYNYILKNETENYDPVLICY